jgi:hypothetical protein
MSDARRRTIVHMRSLLTASAVVGVSMGVADAQDAQPTATKPDGGPAVGEGEWHMQNANPDSGAPNPGMGYGVVDPMPEPSRNRGCGCHKSEPYE